MTKHALSFGVIGLGQGGGNLAAEFHALGYPAIAVNVSEADLSSIEGLEDDAKLFIGKEGMNGTGQNRSVAKERIEAQSDAIMKLVDSKLGEAEILMVTTGLGGGTGGAAADLVLKIQGQERPVVVIAMLPRQSESHVAKICALQGLNDLLDTDFASLILVDNQKVFDVHSSEGVASFLQKGNAEIASLLDRFSHIGEPSNMKSIQTIDDEGLRKVFLSGGISLLGVAEPSSPLTTDNLMDAFQNQVTSNALLAETFDLSDIMAAAAILVASDDVLSETPADEIDRFWKELKKATSGATQFTGIYAADGSSALYALAGGLPLPTRASALLQEATEEAARFSTKKEAKRRIKKLDLSGLSLGGSPVSDSAPDTPTKGMAKHPGPNTEDESAKNDQDDEPQEEISEPVEEEVVEEEVLDLDEGWDEE
ncbi:MAG: hypothetical protein J7M25_12610 [Deltaproteobacteria bacterium]|nr:hypothetical protein [Deltaproteobacteria bacterium]